MPIVEDLIEAIHNGLSTSEFHLYSCSNGYRERKRENRH
jgi:hypothetical protein